MLLNPKSLYTIAKKEFSDNVRNKWILALILIFLFLTIASSFMAGEGEVGELDLTVGMMLSISTMLVPIISIMLGYATISGEAESGALSVVLTCPVRRIEVLLGKFIGLGSVMCFSVLVGFGGSGVIIALTTGDAQWSVYLVFVALTMLVGLLYLSMSIFFSSLLKRRVTSLAAGVLIFFWGMIAGMAMTGLFMATGGSIEDFISGDMTSMPDWFWSEVFLNPMDGYSAAVMLAMGSTEFMGYAFDFPSWINSGSLVLVLLVWTLIPLIIASIWFEKRDV